MGVGGVHPRRRAYRRAWAISASATRGGRAVEPARQTGEDDPAGLLRLAAHGDDRTPRPAARRARPGASVVIARPAATICSLASQSRTTYRTSGRSASPGQTPSSESPALGAARDPDLARELGRPRRPARPRTGGRGPTPTTSSRSDSVVSSSGGDSASGGRNGGVWARTARSSVPARSARVSAGVVPSRSDDHELARQRRQRRGTRPAAAVANAPSRTGPARDVGAGELARGGVELVERPGRRARSSRAPAGVRTTPSRPRSNSAPPGNRLERGDLPGDRRLRVAERARGGRERAGLGDLAQDAQAGGGEVASHAQYAWYLCIILACTHV